LTDAYRPVTSGAYSTGRDVPAHRGGVHRYARRLEPGGISVTSRWLQVPPSEDLRLVATLLSASINWIHYQRRALVAYRESRLTVLVKPSGSRLNWSSLRQFVEQRKYDLVCADIQPGETNRFNRLAESEYYERVSELLSPDRDEFYQAYPYDVRPATDDHPFFHYFTWKQTPELLAAYGKTMQPFGSGYFHPAGAVGLVLLLSVLLDHRPASIQKSPAWPGHDLTADFFRPGAGLFRQPGNRFSIRRNSSDPAVDLAVGAPDVCFHPGRPGAAGVFQPGKPAGTIAWLPRNPS
jgi:hypothetical protein